MSFCLDPLSAAHPGPGRGANSLSMEIQTFNPGHNPEPVERFNLSRVSLVCPGVSSQMDVADAPSQGDVQEASRPAARTTSTSSEEQRFYSELAPDVRALHLISKTEPSRPAGKAKIGRLYLRSNSFGHYPELMTIALLSHHIHHHLHIQLFTCNTSMDQGIWHEELSQILRTHQDWQPSHTVLTNNWDSEESDTESLAQGMVYQKRLQMCIKQNKYTLLGKKNADSLQREDVDDKHSNEDENDNFQVYDNIKVVKHFHAKRNPALQTDVGTKLNKREGRCQLLSGDACSYLCYDPNWRINLNGGRHFSEKPQISHKECYRVPKEKFIQACDDVVVIKGGYKHIVNTCPTAVVAPPMGSSEPEQPYHLHPQDGQNNSLTSPCCHKDAFQLTSPKTGLSRPSRNDNQCANSSHRGLKKKYPELIVDVHTLHMPELNKYHEQLKHTRAAPIQTQQISTSALLTPKVIVKKKVERLKEDMVERNKTTLGCNTSKYSYATMHALKDNIPHNVNKVTLISKEMTAQQKEYSNLSPQIEQPSALEIMAKMGHCLSSPLAQPAVTQPKSQKTTSSQPLPSTFHNINPKTLSHLPLSAQQWDQNAIITRASCHGCDNLGPVSDAEHTLSSGYPQKSIPEPWKSEEEDQNLSATEVCSNQFPQRLPKTLTTISSPCLSSYKVLPAIEKSLMGEDLELSSSQSVTTTYPILRNYSDGYPVQMEKQNQQKAKVTYKAYSLKDYKLLKADIQLRGLGPDYKAIEKTKMRQQKLYSNVIREQNKKISRIPFLSTKELNGIDKKDTRIKALEYAKSIKPSVQTQLKQRQKKQSMGFAEHTFLKGLEMSQPATLDNLRKRHEEEKKAVALFRKGNIV